MLKWECEEEACSNKFRDITNDIEKIGSDFFVKHLKIKKVGGVLWTRGFKVWEYPIIVERIEKIQKDKNRKLKIMDFGCGVTPLGQYLTQFGHEVWGVDYKFEGHLKVPIIDMLKKEYPDVNYYIGDVANLQENNFDVTFSCSVLEHIHPYENLVSVLDVLKRSLNKDGKMLHVVDYYIKRKNIDFYRILKHLNIDFDSILCPGTQEFDLNNVKGNFTNIKKNISRIFLGDD